MLSLIITSGLCNTIDNNNSSINSNILFQNNYANKELLVLFLLEKQTKRIEKANVSSTFKASFS